MLGPQYLAGIGEACLQVFALEMIVFVQNALKKLHAPAYLITDYGSEQYLDLSVKQAAAGLDLLASPWFRPILIAIGALAGTMMSLVSGVGAVQCTVEMVALVGVFLPLLGVQGLQINYSFGDTIDRRRIGWI